MIYKTIKRKGEPVEVVVTLDLDETIKVRDALEIMEPDESSDLATVEYMTEQFSVALHSGMDREYGREAGL